MTKNKKGGRIDILNNNPVMLDNNPVMSDNIKTTTIDSSNKPQAKVQPQVKVHPQVDIQIYNIVQKYKEQKKDFSTCPIEISLEMLQTALDVEHNSDAQVHKNDKGYLWYAYYTVMYNSGEFGINDEENILTITKI